MNVIALMGKAGSGKDSAGRMIVDLMPDQARSLAFADKLKETVMELYGLAWEDVYTEEGKTRPLENMPCLRCPACGSLHIETAGSLLTCTKCTAIGERSGFASFWTPRTILQHVGTEGCRFVDPDIWVKFALRQSAKHLEGVGVEPVKVVVITDCRFLSEAEAIWRAGGEVWRIRRPATDNTAQGLKGHSSETEMDTIPDTSFQRVIHNDATLEVYQQKVSAALAAFTADRLRSR